MAIRSRYHHEVFVGRVPEDGQADARRVTAQMEQHGWSFDRWYYAEGDEAALYTDDPEMCVLVLWLRWSGEQQDQEALRDDPTPKNPNAFGGWNAGTRQYQPHERDHRAVEARMEKMDAHLKHLTGRLEDLSRGHAKLREYIASHPALRDVALPEFTRGVTGEHAEVSPAPRDWAER